MAEINKIWRDGAKDSRFKERRNMRGTAAGSFSIKHEEGTLNYDFTIFPANNILILQGPSIGRAKATSHLAEEIEKSNRRHVIREKRLSTNDMLKVFANITHEDNDSIIKSLTMFFEPQTGFKYSKETYAEISYRFTENRCASDHVDFKQLHKNSKAMNMVVSVKNCSGINETGDAVRLDAKRRCSFRMYRDISADDWDKFCSKILGFLWKGGDGKAHDD